jgi:hypothetical protein
MPAASESCPYVDDGEGCGSYLAWREGATSLMTTLRGSRPPGGSRVRSGARRGARRAGGALGPRPRTHRG